MSAATTGAVGTLATADSLAGQAYRKVLDMIVHRQLAPGDVLVEGRLAGALGVTRTPLREALVRLEGEGLLVKPANHSFTVRTVSAIEFFQSLKVRQYLESKAAARAAGRADPRAIASLRARIRRLARVARQSPEHWRLDNDLHGWLVDSGGNAVLAKTVRDLRITTQLFEIGRPFERAERDAREHLAILHALEDGDPRAAEAAVLAHLGNIESEVRQLLTGS